MLNDEEKASLNSDNCLALMLKNYLDIVDMKANFKQKAVAELIPQVRQKTEEHLKQQGIDLKRLETDGYSPYCNLGDVRVLPADTESGYLLVNDVNELKRGVDKRYLVMNGKVERRTYMQWKEDENLVGSGRWTLFDQRNGQLNEQGMGLDKDGYYQPAKLDGHIIPNPYLYYGYQIVVGNEQFLPKGPKLSNLSTGWVKKLL